MILQHQPVHVESDAQKKRSSIQNRLENLSATFHFKGIRLKERRTNIAVFEFIYTILHYDKVTTLEGFIYSKKAFF
jgi:hypothetical protein